MSTQDNRGQAAGLRDRRVARVLDREISPVWHDRFARLIVRNLPTMPEVLALDIHCGAGRTTSELLHRLGAGARVLAIDPDEGAIELAKTRMRPEWKNRVYFKPGHFDDVTAMADDSYGLVVANLVLGESVDLGTAIGEMIRVCKIGGRLLATVPLQGTWDEVEDIFAEILRDAGMTAALRRLEALRAIRPTGPQLGQMLRNLGVVEDDYVIEHERFQLLFPSGREFLFAPVIEHGPLQMWKAVIGKDGAPQELFWRLKEAIDTYYSGHVLAVNVHAGLVQVEVAKGTARPGPRLAARFWRHYPELDKLWGGLAVGYTKVSDPILPFSDGDISDFDLDIDLDESIARRRTGALKALTSELAAVKPVETPSPEDFGLRFRTGESSGTRPVEAEPSGTRPVSPASEASGLRALDQLRDKPEPAPKATPVAAPEDDFSELNDTLPAKHKPAKAAAKPAAAAKPEDDFSGLDARAEDDFSELNDAPPARAERPSRSPARSTSPTPDSVKTRAPTTDSVKSRAPDPDSVKTRAPDPDSVKTRAPTPDSVKTRAPTTDSVKTRAPEPAATPDSVKTRAPEPAATPDSVKTRAPEPAATPDSVKTRAPDPDSVKTRAPEPEPATTPDSVKTRAPEPEPTRTPEPEPERPARPVFRPIGSGEPLRKPTDLPTFRPPPTGETSSFTRPPGGETSGFTKLPTSETSSFTRPPSGETSGFTKLPTFKPPPPKEPAEAPRTFKPPPPKEPDDEPAELLDDIEPVEELEPEPAPAGPTKPPPPKAPPPIGLKPRPLQPIFTPPDKKK